MFLNSVGTEECREKIKKFQRAFLSKRDEVRNLLMKDAEQGQIRFAWDYDFVLEYMTLEYSFAFWQWGQTKCEDIPEPDASAEVLYNHMKASNPLYFFTEQAMSVLMSYNWPGNVRELKNLVERYCIVSPAARIEKSHLPVEILNYKAMTESQQINSKLNREYLMTMLQASNWNKSRVSRQTGIPLSTLCRILKRLNLSKPR